MKKPWNPDTQNITVTTNSTVGSKETVELEFHTSIGWYAGGVEISFDTPIRYKLGYCTSWINFPPTVTAAPQKIWTITYKYNTKEPSVVIHCNEVQVANVPISENECTVSFWKKFWELEPTQLHFSPFWDTASDSYCFSG